MNDKDELKTRFEVYKQRFVPTHSQRGTRMKWVVSTTRRTLYPRERRGTRCAGFWVCLGASLAPTSIRTPDRPARSALLYRLRYTGLFYTYIRTYKYKGKVIPLQARCGSEGG